MPSCSGLQTWDSLASQYENFLTHRDAAPGDPAAWMFIQDLF
jgi:hypothetical protein